MEKSNDSTEHQDSPASSIPGPELLGRKVSIPREVEIFHHEPARPQGVEEPLKGLTAPGIRVNPRAGQDGKSPIQLNPSGGQEVSSRESDFLARQPPPAEFLRHISQPYEGAGAGIREALKEEDSQGKAEFSPSSEPSGFLEFVSEEKNSNESRAGLRENRQQTMEEPVAIEKLPIAEKLKVLGMKMTPGSFRRWKTFGGSAVSAGQQNIGNR